MVKHMSNVPQHQRLKNLMTKYQFEYGTDVPKIFDLAEEGNEEALNILNEWSSYVL